MVTRKAIIGISVAAAVVVIVTVAVVVSFVVKHRTNNKHQTNNTVKLISAVRPGNYDHMNDSVTLTWAAPTRDVGVQIVMDDTVETQNLGRASDFTHTFPATKTPEYRVFYWDTPDNYVTYVARNFGTVNFKVDGTPVTNPQTPHLDAVTVEPGGFSITKKVTFKMNIPDPQRAVGIGARNNEDWEVRVIVPGDAITNQVEEYVWSNMKKYDNVVDMAVFYWDERDMPEKISTITVDMNVNDHYTE